jgi:chitinase
MNKIILGVAAYGHSFYVNQTSALDASGNLNLYSPFDKAQQPAGDKWDSTATGAGAGVCGETGVVSGVFNFWGLVEGGFLTEDGVAASGIDYKFDNCSKTVRVRRAQCLPYLSDHRST